MINGYLISYALLNAEFLAQLGISAISAVAMGVGVYVGIMRALATHEERLNNHRNEIDELKQRVERLEAPYFQKSTTPP